MKITDFNKLITDFEGKKKSIDIAQVSEIMKIVNFVTEGFLYRIIKHSDEVIVKSMLKTINKPVTKNAKSIVVTSNKWAVTKNVKSTKKSTPTKVKTKNGKTKKS